MYLQQMIISMCLNPIFDGAHKPLIIQINGFSYKPRTTPTDTSRKRWRLWCLTVVGCTTLVGMNPINNRPEKINLL